MARPWRIRYAGAKYHITVRGNGRQEIFHDPEDYQRFLMQLSEALEKDEVILYTYVLMLNHYHLFIETPLGNVQRFMQRINTAYSMYHRYKHASPGHCFQGRYGAKLVSGDDYITALTRYIHLNPVKAKACRARPTADCVKLLRAYPWSSYRGYIRKRQKEEMVDYRWLKLLGPGGAAVNRERYRGYVESFIKQTDDDFCRASAASRYAIGDERFIEQVESDLDDVRENKGVYGDISWPVGHQVPIGVVVDTVAREFGLEPVSLQGRGYSARLAKKVALELCCLCSGETQRTVGRHFGYSGNGSVAKQRDRLRDLLKTDQGLAKRFKILRKDLDGG